MPDARRGPGRPVLRPERGPARRVYSITESGEQQLEASMPALASLLRTVRGMLNRYRSGT